MSHLEGIFHSRVGGVSNYSTQIWLIESEIFAFVIQEPQILKSKLETEFQTRGGGRGLIQGKVNDLRPQPVTFDSPSVTLQTPESSNGHTSQSTITLSSPSTVPFSSLSTVHISSLSTVPLSSPSRQPCPFSPKLNNKVPQVKKGEPVENGSKYFVAD